MIPMFVMQSYAPESDQYDVPRTWYAGGGRYTAAWRGLRATSVGVEDAVKMLLVALGYSWPVLVRQKGRVSVVWPDVFEYGDEVAARVEDAASVVWQSLRSDQDPTDGDVHSGRSLRKRHGHERPAAG